MSNATPLVSFYRLIDSARVPQRADRSAGGTLPTRAFRYCDAVTRASGFGWYVFAPMEFHLLFDGADVFWTFDGADGWLPLQDAAQFPNMAAHFDTNAPEELRGCSPPFLTSIVEAGVVQVWTGLIARSAPGWDLLVRPPANLWIGGGYSQYEGIVATDRWFGPLFTNLRLTRTDTPIRIRADVPLLQVQPLPRSLVDETMLGEAGFIDGMGAFAASDWADYTRTVVAPNDDNDRRPGQYAVEARRSRRGECPFKGASEAAGAPQPG
jgi:hypothetical protein